MSHTFPELPYSYDALEPYIDAKTMEVHYSANTTKPITINSWLPQKAALSRPKASMTSSLAFLNTAQLSVTTAAVTTITSFIGTACHQMVAVSLKVLLQNHQR